MRIDVPLLPHRPSIVLRALLVATLACLAGDAPLSGASLTSAAFDPGRIRLSLSLIAKGFDSPLLVTNAGDRSRRLFVVEQGGRIKIVKGTTVLSRPFLDISALTHGGGERGLLGLAFHPVYETNRRFYVDYTDVNGNTVIAEYRASTTNPDVAVPSTQRILLRIAQPYANHNGGNLAFGPDGYLYIAMGDGGDAGDPGNRAQDLNSRLGKLLRIDVDHPTATRPYGIPRTNPFVGRTGLDDIWAYGLRNPWRFSFDRATGDLWIGDVGQDRFEEIDWAPRSSGGGRGANFGWRVMEGNGCFNPPSGCSTTGKRLPVAVYDHSLGCAVTGGFVYRGTAYPLLHGAYVFGDYCSGRIWSLSATGPARQFPVQLIDTNHAISSFGENESGELFLTDLNSGGVYKLVATSR